MMDAESAFLSRDDQTGTHPSHAAMQSIRLGQHSDNLSVTTVLPKSMAETLLKPKSTLSHAKAVCVEVCPPSAISIFSSKSHLLT